MIARLPKRKHLSTLLIHFAISLAIAMLAAPNALAGSSDPGVEHLPLKGENSSWHPSTLPGESPPYQAYLPVVLHYEESLQQSSLEAFIHSVADGYPEEVRGVYVDGVLALHVVQQPDGDSEYISRSVKEATQYNLAKLFGVTGLIAHNYLAGDRYFNLEIGQIVQIIYGDGSMRSYQVTEIARYQAQEPGSFSSSFTNLANGETLTAAQLFAAYYMGGDHVTFQTCFAEDGNSQTIGYTPNWGRLIILATPLSDPGSIEP